MRIEELENKIIYHKSLYYQGRPEISDADYDRLEEELKAIDPLNPILSLVGHCHNESASTKVKHNEKMLSLDKVYDIDQLMDWTKGNDVVSTLKVDGVSCSIIYKNGKLDLAKTRGDGVFGENITDKVLWVKEIPKSIKIQSDIEIRGELYLSEENFFQLSNEMVQRNLEKPSNPRNIVAGLMGRKENIDLCRHIQFFAFDLIPNRYQEHGEEWVEVKREIEKEKILQKNLFQCPKIELHKFQKDSLEQFKKSLLQEVEFAKEFMSEGDYQIDGLVLTYDRIELQNELGATAHHPRYKMAFKFVGEAKQTQIIDPNFTHKI